MGVSEHLQLGCATNCNNHTVLCADLDRPRSQDPINTAVTTFEQVPGEPHLDYSGYETKVQEQGMHAQTHDVMASA